MTVLLLANKLGEFKTGAIYGLLIAVIIVAIVLLYKKHKKQTLKP